MRFIDIIRKSLFRSIILWNVSYSPVSTRPFRQVKGVVGLLNELLKVFLNLLAQIALDETDADGHRDAIRGIRFYAMSKLFSKRASGSSARIREKHDEFFIPVSTNDI